MLLPTPKGRPRSAVPLRSPKTAALTRRPIGLVPRDPAAQVRSLASVSHPKMRPGGPPLVGVPKDAGQRQCSVPFHPKMVSFWAWERSRGPKIPFLLPVSAPSSPEREGFADVQARFRHALVGRLRRSLSPPRKVGSAHFGDDPDSTSSHLRPTLSPGGAFVGCRRGSLRRAPPVRPNFHASRRRCFRWSFELRLPPPKRWRR